MNKHLRENNRRIFKSHFRTGYIQAFEKNVVDAGGIYISPHQNRGVLHSLSIKNIFYDKMDLRLFYFDVAI